MSSDAPDISVVIYAYTERRWHDLAGAVASVRRQTVPAREIIVVVDHNHGLLERVRRDLPDVVAVASAGPKGLSAARNTGAAFAGGNIVAYLDDDAQAEPEWLARLLACYDDPRVLGAGGVIEPAWPGARPGWFPREFQWVVGCAYQGMPEQVAEVRNLIGANMSIRRDVLAAAGGFRDGFGCDHDAGNRSRRRPWLQPRAGDEETELCIRARRIDPGGVWLYAPQAAVRHRIPAERARWRYFLWRCFDEGLGKARLVGLHGSRLGLASERAYTFKTLPRGAIRGVVDAGHGDISGLGRAVAIAGGLAATAGGYALGVLSRALGVESRAPYA